MASKDILVFVEQRDGKIKKASLEVLSEGRRLADKTGGRVTAVVAGKGIEPLAAVCGSFGADVVYLADDAIFETYSNEAVAHAVADIVTKTEPLIVLAAATAMGKDFMPRVAARVSAGLAPDCIRTEVDAQGGVRVVRPVYAGKAYATVEWPAGGPRIATLRPNVFSAGSPVEGRACEVQKYSPSIDASSVRARVKEVMRAEGGEADVAEADIVVSGGRGVKARENFQLIRDLALALRGATGASRAAVDSEWIDHKHQVGQTGKTVQPFLYVACGISGAIQHLAGMAHSKHIIAINKDPEAPVFRVADLGIVGDLFQILPPLIEEIRKRKAAG
jgi:electron transfer flavoprotein alpha subunit